MSTRIKRIKRMVAKFAYEAQNEGDVSVRLNETMWMQNSVEEAEASGWAVVVKNDDSEGSVPYSYLQIAAAPPPPPPPPFGSSDSKTTNAPTPVITKDVSARSKEFEDREKQSELEKNPYAQIHFIKHPNKAGFTLVDGLNVRFVPDGSSKTLFFDRPVNEGIWKLSLMVEGYGGTEFAIGIARVRDVKNTMVSLIGTQVNTGVSLRQSVMSSYIGNNDGSTSERLLPKDDTKGVDGGMVSVEVDTKKHLMHFFNNGKQLNYFVTDVPSFVLFGFGSAGMHTVKFLSLDELLQTSADELLDVVPIRWAG